MKKILFLMLTFLIITGVGLFLIYSTRPQAFIFLSLFSIAILFIIFHYNNWLRLTHKNLFKQPLFIASIALPIYMFIMYGLWVWKGHDINFSSTGFNNFLDITKLPLLILASSVPLAAIISNLHRTIQTEAQINLSETKNAIDRYLAHEKNFIEKIKEISEVKLQHLCDKNKDIRALNEEPFIAMATSNCLKISNPYFLYSKIYKNATTGLDSNYLPDMSFLSELERILENINDNLSSDLLSNNTPSDIYIHRLNNLSYNASRLFDLLCVDCISNTRVKIQIDDYQILTFTTEDNILVDIIEAGYLFSKKIALMFFGKKIDNYEKLNHYLYDNDYGFNLCEFVTDIEPISSPEWISYVTKDVITLGSGGTLAAER